MSKLEEMVETFCAATLAERRQTSPETTRIGLLAVFEKHVKAMVAEAYFDGVQSPAEGAAFPSHVYAAKVIAQVSEDAERIRTPFGLPIFPSGAPGASHQPDILESAARLVETATIPASLSNRITPDVFQMIAARDETIAASIRALSELKGK